MNKGTNEGQSSAGSKEFKQQPQPNKGNTILQSQV